MIPRFPHRRRGATTVEFALTAPILFALVLGAIEFSRANMLVHTTAIAATEAARRSIIPGATANDVRLKALDELDNVGIVDATVKVDPEVIDDDTAQVTVDLTVPVTMRNGYGLSRVFLGKQVFKSVTLQREGKSEDLATETVKADGIQKSTSTTSGSSGNSGSSASSGTGASNSGSSSSSSSGNSGASGNGNNGNGNGNGGGNGSNGKSGSAASGFLGALRSLLGL
jgi:Flp pilus assembly protein TadG